MANEFDLVGFIQFLINQPFVLEERTGKEQLTIFKNKIVRSEVGKSRKEYKYNTHTISGGKAIFEIEKSDLKTITIQTTDLMQGERKIFIVEFGATFGKGSNKYVPKLLTVKG